MYSFCLSLEPPVMGPCSKDPLAPGLFVLLVPLCDSSALASGTNVCSFPAPVAYALRGLLRILPEAEPETESKIQGAGESEFGKGDSQQAVRHKAGYGACSLREDGQATELAHPQVLAPQLR